MSWRRRFFYPNLEKTWINFKTILQHRTIILEKYNLLAKAKAFPRKPSELRTKSWFGLSAAVRRVDYSSLVIVHTTNIIWNKFEINYRHIVCSFYSTKACKSFSVPSRVIISSFVSAKFASSNQLLPLRNHTKPKIIISTPNLFHHHFLDLIIIIFPRNIVIK